MDACINLVDKFKIGGRSTFIIAEIGQNHQGDINIAKELIKTAQLSGADCVKFQKTNLTEKFNKAALNREYFGQNSWGKTYGEHKAYLEFSDEEFIELQKYAEDLGILFTASAMDTHSLKFLKKLNVPFIKIGSGDANNFPLIQEAAKMNVPLIISTGMQNMETVERIYEIVSKEHKNFVLMHCVSAYPTPLEDLNLNLISFYKRKFPDIVIGYSGHELGIDISLAAVAMGSKVIERHFTLDQNAKGSDHKCSLNPKEFQLLVKKIRCLEIALGSKSKEIRKSELECYRKLGKTLVASRKLQEGKCVEIEDIKVKVAEPKGIDGAEIKGVLGRKLKVGVEEDESITEEMLI